MEEEMRGLVVLSLGSCLVMASCASRTGVGATATGAALVAAIPAAYHEARQERTIDVVPGLGTEYQLSLAEGEQEIGHLSQRAAKEDAWAYLDRAGVWKDIGLHEATADVEIDLEGLRPLFTSSVTRGGTIYVYHIHPSAALPAGRVYPPSFGDIYAHARLKRALRQRDGLSLTSRVLDGTGIWEYDTSDAFEDDLRLPDYSGETPRWIAYPEIRPYRSALQLMVEMYERWQGYFLDRVDPIASDGALTRAARIAQTVAAAARRGVFLRYHDLP
jgi:hypothetical protein